MWHWVLSGALILFLAACSSGGGGSPDPDPPPAATTPAQVTSNLPAGGSGVAGEEYTFGLVYDENLQAGTSAATMATGDDVIFSWVFGDGKDAGTATVTVDANGKAFYEVKHTYDQDGRYGVVFGVEDPDGNVLASTNFIVEIGSVIVQEFTIKAAQCDGTYFAGGEGLYGTSLHNWDVSELASGTVLDFHFNTWGIPDKIIIDYPTGNSVYDSGWRGDAYWDGDILYPGGVESPPIWDVDELMTISTANNFLMTIIGPDPGTAWEYWIACHNK